MIITSVYILFLNILITTAVKLFPIIRIPNGRIRGTIHENYVAFKSIPYAEPPVGENRFEPPKPYTKKWKGIREATTFSNDCMQWSVSSKLHAHLSGKEDCLYLNVYVPHFNETTNVLHPVIFYIHGESFTFGSVNFFSGELLLKEKKFVHVNFNYRLGPLGFAATEDDQISGNMGLKDQLLALKWVKDNIKIFGGDPEKIIMIGHSFGAASVHMHLLSGKIDGLVKAAVSHSGTALCPWAMLKNPLERTLKLAKNVNCFHNNTQDIKKCLKKINAENIVSSVKIFQKFMYNPFMVFGPTIEPKSNYDTFLSDDPEVLIKSGRISKIPWLVSYVSDEGTYNAMTMMQKKSNGSEIINDLNDIWTKIGRDMLFTSNQSLVNKLKHDYMGNDNFSVKSYLKFQNMFSDHLFLNGIEKAIRLHTDYTNQSVFIFKYKNPFEIGFGNILSLRSDINFGTSHGDDLFIFLDDSVIKLLQLTNDIYKIAKNYVELYKSFVNDGIPKYNGITFTRNTSNSTDIFQYTVKIDNAEGKYVKHITHHNYI